MNKNEVMQAIRSSQSLPELISKLKADDADPVFYYWAMRMFLDKRAREKAVPLKGVFELTPLCNFDCRMCYVHLDSSQMNKKPLLSAGEWEKIMREAVENGMMYATLTGGECLTYPDFQKIYLFLQKNSVQISVLTNGALLNSEMIEFLRKNPPLSVQVTIYGANEEMYERVTGKRDFEKVMNNLRRANEALLPISITVTPNPYLTKEEIGEVIRLASSFSTTFRVNSALITPREQTLRDKGFVDLDIDDYIDFFKLELSLKGQLPPAECEIDLPAEGGNATAAPKGLRCGGGRSVFNITWEGRMVPCNRLTDISANPFEDGFASAWKKINQQVSEYLLPVECEECAYKYASRGCAAAHADAERGHASSQECRWCRGMVKSSLAKVITKA